MEPLNQRLQDHRRRLKWVGISLGITVFIAASVLIFFILTLPSMSKVTDYRPPITTQIFSNDLELIGEFTTQYRLVTPLENIPVLVQKAFIAAEDNRFYEHRGIDYFGIVRALVKNLTAGGVKQGGSTITQQVAKSLLLTPERTLSRKIKEAILAFVIESKLTKEEILYLYLNQIYLGHGAYGVAAGARAYFNKELNQLQLGEIAILAGLPTAPSRDNPFKNPERAKQRQAYVLKAMQEMNAISAEERQQAEAATWHLDDRNADLNRTTAPYFTEHVRRYLIEKYGEQKLYEEGLKVYTSLSLPAETAAREAVRWNLEELDKRQGYRGPIKNLTQEQQQEQIKAWQNRVATPTDTVALPAMPKESFERDKIQAVVLEVDNRKQWVKVHSQDGEGVIPLELMKWARKVNPEVLMEEAWLTQPSQALKRGDLILVRHADLSEIAKDKQKSFSNMSLYALEQEPAVQGALLAINPANGFIVAMVGGYDYRKSEFNRAIQAKRQPGSAFKPIVYAAALDKGYTPVTTILDAPEVYDDPLNDTVWRPKNYSGDFKGEMLFRTALIESRNVVTIKILQDIGIDYVIDYAKKLGIVSPLARDNTTALGSSVVTPIELTQAYSVFANGGVEREPVFIKKILDRDGNELERHTQDDLAVDISSQIEAVKQEMMLSKIEPIVIEEKKTDDNEETEPSENQPVTKLRIQRQGQVISEETAYIMTHLLNEVVNYGTGARARALNRPAAGKTGTTNDHIDAWFVGFTPDLLATAWVGFDDPSKTLGRLETGSRAASPMWLRFMSQTLEDRPQKVFRTPAGITFVKIDAVTGKLASDKTEKSVVEAFRDGTEPQESAGKTSTSKDFFLEE